MATQSSAVEEPEFISFLFSSELKHDCFFLVGNNKQMKPERIGVVRAMLMAHSVVLRLELEDSKLAEKGEVPVPDIYPDIFRILLRYVYGNDITAALCFDEANNLLYVAEKYLMVTLMKKLATRLMSLLNAENICSLLNNPACYTHLELKSAITEILRYETDRVLASPLFLGLSPDGFVKILEQDGLNVPEIELWRAMMKWGKHNADTEDGKALRNQVSKLVKHVRFCSLDVVQFCQEVVPTKILKSEEVELVCISVAQQEKQEGLTEICNEIKPRSILQKTQNTSKSVKEQFELQFINHEKSLDNDIVEFNFSVVTKQCDIELLPLDFRALDHPQVTPESATYEVSCTTTITRITDRQNDTSTETPVTVRFKQRVEYGTTFMIPLTSGGDNVTLLPNNKYTFSMVFGGYQPCYHDSRETPEYDNSHLSLSIHPCEAYGNQPYVAYGDQPYDAYGGTDHYLPINALKYKATAV